MRVPYRPIAFVALTIGILLAWQHYRTAAWLHVGVRAELGKLLPLYTRTLAIDLADPARSRALLVAVESAVAGVAGVAIVVARRFSTISCLLVALVAVWTTNVAVAHVRDDHAGFVAPFARRGLEYHGDVPAVRDDPRKFVADYPLLAARRRISHHAGTHPPGGVLFLWAGQRLFGPAPPPEQRPARDPATLKPIVRQIWELNRARRASEYRGDRTLDASVWLAVTFTAIGVLPAFALAHLAGGAAAARRLLTLYVVAPNLVLFGATSMDGVFLTFTLAALAAGVAAARRRGFIWPIVAGIALWLATFLTYAAIVVPVLLGCLVLADAAGQLARAWRRRRDGGPAIVRPRWQTARAIARVAAIGVVFVVCQGIAHRAIGYDFRACAESAMRVDARGLGITGYESLDLWACVSLGNALALLFGGGVCATALATVALASRRPLREPIVRFGLATAATLAILATSTLFTLETERVWLALTPAFLATATRAFRGWTIWTLAPLGLIAQLLWTEANFYTWW